MEQQYGDAKPDDKREKGTRAFKRFCDVEHYFLLRLASRFKESASTPQGTSIAWVRIQPVSVWKTPVSYGDGTVTSLREGGTMMHAINMPMITPAAIQARWNITL